MIARSRSTILPSIVRWQRDLAKTSEWQSCPAKSLACWLLGYPEAALADTEQALKDAREIGQAATLMYVLHFSAWTNIYCGNYAAANALVDELIALTDEKGVVVLEGMGDDARGCLIGPDRQSRGRSPNDHLRPHRNAINRNNHVDAVVLSIWREPMRKLANSMMLALH